MEKAGRRKAQLAVEPELPRRGGKQIAAPHDLRDTAERVVADHGKLIGEDPVRSAQNEVAAVCRQVFAVFPENAVGKADGFLRHPDAPGRCPSLCGPLLLR